MAVWRRKPKQRVLIHSDQGSQFTSMDWAAFIRAHNLEHAMSRRGNCHDNAVAESFFSSLKRERIRRRTCKTREEAFKVGREVDGMAVSGVGMTGKRVPHQDRVREVIGVWSSLIARELVPWNVTMFES